MTAKPRPSAKFANIAQRSERFTILTALQCLNGIVRISLTVLIDLEMFIEFMQETGNFNSLSASKSHFGSPLFSILDKQRDSAACLELQQLSMPLSNTFAFHRPTPRLRHHAETSSARRIAGHPVALIRTEPIIHNISNDMSVLSPKAPCDSTRDISISLHLDPLQGWKRVTCAQVHVSSP